MTKIIEIIPKGMLSSSISQRFKAIFEKRNKRDKEPLTIEEIRKRPGLENLSEEEAKQIIQTIKNLASLFFEIACLKDTICIDNQHVVSLDQENKAA